MVKFCCGDIGIDLSVKLGLVKTNRQAKTVVRFTGAELSRLADVLKQKASGETVRTYTKKWAYNLAEYLLKRNEEMKIAV